MKESSIIHTRRTNGAERINKIQSEWCLREITKIMETNMEFIQRFWQSIPN